MNPNGTKSFCDGCCWSGDCFYLIIAKPCPKMERRLPQMEDGLTAPVEWHGRLTRRMRPPGLRQSDKYTKQENRFIEELLVTDNMRTARERAQMTPQEAKTFMEKIGPRRRGT